MNAYERIDDYELLDGVALTEAQENNVADNIRAALDEFRPLRLNTRKTRTLFNKKYHLWPVQTDFGRVVPPEPVLKPDSVDLNSIIFLYSLYTVVKEDPSYSLLHNFIVTELTSRNINLRLLVRHCDESRADFFVKFDMTDIGLESQQKEEGTDRLDYLDSKLEELYKYDFSSFGNKEKVKLVNSIESQLQSLIREARAAHEAATVAVLNQDGIEDASDPVEEVLDGDGLIISDWSDTSDLCYNPTILGLAHFHDMDFELYANYASSDGDNQEFFSIWLYYTFTTCYYYDPKTRFIVTEHSRIWKACSTIWKLLDDYVNRLESSSTEWTFLSKAERLAYWIRVTLEHIEDAFSRFGFIDSSKYVQKGESMQIVDTQYLRNGLVSYAFASLISHRKLIHGAVPDRFNSVVFYNFWPDTYEDDFETYYHQLGLTPENRAKVYLKANREFFKERMKSIGEEFVSDFELNPDSYSYLSEQTKASTAKLLQEMFYNYMVRLSSHFPDEDERASAGLNWIIETMHILKLQLTEQVGRARMRPSLSEESRDVFEYFYLDCCMLVLNKMLTDFIDDNSELHNDSCSPDYVFDDSGIGDCEWEMFDGDEFELDENGEIVPIETTEVDPPGELTEEHPSGDKADAGDEDKTVDNNRIRYTPLGGVSINVSAIYNVVKGLEKTGLAETDFSDAIYYADFAALRQDGIKNRLRDYPLLVICELKDLFDAPWYVACCRSLGMNASRVSGYHSTGTMGKLKFRFPGNLTIQT